MNHSIKARLVALPQSRFEEPDDAISPRDAARSLAALTLLALSASSLPASAALSGGAEGDPISCLSNVTGRLYATPTSVPQFGTTTLSWSVNLSSCPATVRLTGVSNPGTSGSATVNVGAGNSQYTATYRLTAYLSGQTKFLRDVVINVGRPQPVDGRTTFHIRYNNQVGQFVEAVGTRNATVLLADGVSLNLTGYEGINIQSGVHIIGERTSAKPGPLIFTDTEPRVLFRIGNREMETTADDVLISGIRLRGGAPSDPFSNMGDHESAAISVWASKNVQIDHSEIYRWDIAVSAEDLYRDNIDSRSAVRVLDNYLHDNQHPTRDGVFDGSGHGAGYGVVVRHGAYALVERNVFHRNRHAIAAGGQEGTGYLARHNLILEAGYEARYPTGTTYSQNFDVHGSECNYYCGLAGEQFVVQFNAFVMDTGKGIFLRGTPSIGMSVTHNVFAQSGSDTFETSEPSDRVVFAGNLNGVSHLGEQFDGCDFDGDARSDSFLATGASWWFKGSTGHWNYLHTSKRLRTELTVADLDGDGRCEVRIDATGEVVRPILKVGSSGASGPGAALAMARQPDGRLVAFALDRAGGIWRRSQTLAGGDGTQWSPWLRIHGWLSSIAAETNRNGQIEVFGSNSNGEIWRLQQIAPNTDSWSNWVSVQGALKAVALARHADGRLELFGTNALDQIWHRTQDANDLNRWSEWASLPGLLSSIAAQANSTGQIEVYGVNSEGLIWHTRQSSANDAASWTAWEQIPGVDAAPGVVKTIAVGRDGATGRLHLVCTTSGGVVFQNGQSEPGRWSGWTKVSGHINNVALEQKDQGDGGLEVIGSGWTDGNVYRAVPFAGQPDRFEEMLRVAR